MFGNINNELRQKLINLMYLVFITLAFIYLPSDFVDTTKYLRRTFEVNAQEYKDEINTRSSLLNEQLYINTPLEVDYRNVVDVIGSIDSALSHVDVLNGRIEKEMGGYGANNYLYNSKNFLISNQLMVNGGEAAILKTRLNTIKQKLRSYNLIGITYFIDTLLPPGTIIISSTGKERQWEDFFFSKTPVSMVMTNLAKIKSDLTLTKLKLVEYLASNISSSQSDKSISILSSNSIAVEVLAAKTFVLGDKVAFRVILNDSGKKGYGNVKSYVKKDGKIVKTLAPGEDGMMSFYANETGKFQLVIEDSAQTTTQDFYVSNLRAAHPEKSNYDVLYMGIDNPIQVYTTGIQNEKLSLEVDMGEVIPFEGKYYLRFNREGLSRLKVYVVNNEGRYLAVEKTFEVKKLPDPEVLIDGKPGGPISSKILAIKDRLELKANLPNGSAADVYNIVSFDVIRVHATGKETQVNRGNDFNQPIRKMIRDAINGDLLIFENIRIKATDGTLKDVAPLVFRVK